jgi:predicted AAA+ superfamily ATPase
MMIERPYWLGRIQEAWEKRSLVWLAGVRRTGKTTLAKALPKATFLNCDLPSVRKSLEDPESFLSSVETPLLILDEIHRLENPSQLLKIAADQFPNLWVLATGSSTLTATRKFQDALTDRKRTVRLVPMLPEECEAFGVKDLKRRLLCGGLPPAILSENRDPEFYADWMDAFYARDISELFAIEKRQPFIRLLEILLRQNGALADSAKFGQQTGLSRPTVVKYLDVLEITQAITIVRPFHAGGRQEILQQPRIYGFDTGFVCFANGWDRLRADDCGRLLENLVLESLQAIPLSRQIHFWRTKQKQDVDFVVPAGNERVDAIECKWQAKEFSPDHLKRFREDYPEGRNFVVSTDSTRPHTQKVGGLEIRFVDIRQFRRVFTPSAARPESRP